MGNGLGTHELPEAVPHFPIPSFPHSRAAQPSASPDSAPGRIRRVDHRRRRTTSSRRVGRRDSRRSAGSPFSQAISSRTSPHLRSMPSSMRTMREAPWMMRRAALTRPPPSEMNVASGATTARRPSRSSRSSACTKRSTSSRFVSRDTWNRATLGAHALARTVHHLAACGLAAIEHARELGVVDAEHLAQEEGRALLGGEPLEQDEERHRQIGRELGTPVGAVAVRRS